jgi:hypothetical protein
MMLPTALVVMMLFAILCVSMFTLSHMSTTYDLYFEQRTILEHATLSMANTLAMKLNDWSGDGKQLWTDPSDLEEGNGSLVVDKSLFGSTYSGLPMKFTFQIIPPATTGRAGYLRLSVRGEYSIPTVTNSDMAWLVSMDVAKWPLSKDKTEWLDIAFGSPDARPLWTKEGQ